MLYFLVIIKSGQIIIILFRIQMQSQANRMMESKIDMIIIDPYHNRLVTTV
jgi:hypothetical protein